MIIRWLIFAHRYSKPFKKDLICPKLLRNYSPRSENELTKVRRRVAMMRKEEARKDEDSKQREVNRNVKELIKSYNSNVPRLPVEAGGMDKAARWVPELPMEYSLPRMPDEAGVSSLIRVPRLEAEGMTGGQHQVEQQLSRGAYLTGTRSRNSPSRSSMLGVRQVNKLINKQHGTDRNKEGGTETSLKEEPEVNKLAKKLTSYLTGTQSSSGRSETSQQEDGQWTGGQVDQQTNQHHQEQGGSEQGG